jgi:DNA repair exonuclease SbcCD ATPase subunit
MSGHPDSAETVAENGHSPEEGPEDQEETLQQLATRVEVLESEQERARDKRMSLLETLQDQQERIDDQQDRIEELEAQVDRLRDRTDLMDAIKDATVLKPEQRAAVLLQTLYNEAWTKAQRSTKNPPTAEMDYKQAGSALGGSIDQRPKLYAAMEKAAELVAEKLGENDIVSFIKEDRHAIKNTRLQVDL